MLTTKGNSFCLILTGILCFAALVGCNSDSLIFPDESGSAAAELQKPQPGTTEDRLSNERALDSCTNVSGLLLGINQLVLTNAGSTVTYPAGSVLVPTIVSFGICDLDAGGTAFGRKAQVFGPLTLLFLNEVQVRLSLEDAGLPEDAVVRNIRVYRKDDATGQWGFHQYATITAGQEVAYRIVRNGIYALSLDSLSVVVDTLWTVSGMIDPVSGGVLHLLNSSLVVPPGAVANTMMLTFTISATVPPGLPNACARILEFSPDGTTFQVPATLRVSPYDLGFEGQGDEPIYLYFFDETSATWKRQPNVVERINNEFVVQLFHFSRYAFAR
jgi:hypothetical protein